MILPLPYPHTLQSAFKVFPLFFVSIIMVNSSGQVSAIFLSCIASPHFLYYFLLKLQLCIFRSPFSLLHPLATTIFSISLSCILVNFFKFVLQITNSFFSLSNLLFYQFNVFWNFSDLTNIPYIYIYIISE